MKEIPEELMSSVCWRLIEFSEGAKNADSAEQLDTFQRAIAKLIINRVLHEREEQ